VNLENKTIGNKRNWKQLPEKLIPEILKKEIRKGETKDHAHGPIYKARCQHGIGFMQRQMDDRPVWARLALQYGANGAVEDAEVTLSR